MYTLHKFLQALLVYQARLQEGMLNRSISLAVSTSVLKALPGKLLDTKYTHLVFSILIVIDTCAMHLGLRSLSCFSCCV